MRFTCTFPAGVTVSWFPFVMLVIPWFVDLLWLLSCWLLLMRTRHLPLSLPTVRAPSPLLTGLTAHLALPCFFPVASSSTRTSTLLSLFQVLSPLSSFCPLSWCPSGPPGCSGTYLWHLVSSHQTPLPESSYKASYMVSATCRPSPPL